MCLLLWRRFADGTKQYTSSALGASHGDAVCGSSNSNWDEEIYSTHKTFAHTADSLTIKVRLPACLRACSIGRLGCMRAHAGAGAHRAEPSQWHLAGSLF